MNLCFCYLNRRHEKLASSAYCASVLRVYFIMVFFLRRWAVLFFHWMLCPLISGVPAPCWLFMQHTAGLGKSSWKTVTASLHVASLHSTLWNLISGCALSISDEDAILIKYFQYFVYDIIRKENNGVSVGTVISMYTNRWELPWWEKLRSPQVETAFWGVRVSTNGSESEKAGVFGSTKPPLFMTI